MLFKKSLHRKKSETSWLPESSKILSDGGFMGSSTGESAVFRVIMKQKHAHLLFVFISSKLQLHTNRH